MPNSTKYLQRRGVGPWLCTVDAVAGRTKTALMLPICDVRPGWVLCGQQLTNLARAWQQRPRRRSTGAPVERQAALGRRRHSFAWRHLPLGTAAAAARRTLPHLEHPAAHTLHRRTTETNPSRKKLSCKWLAGPIQNPEKQYENHAHMAHALSS